MKEWLSGLFPGRQKKENKHSEACRSAQLSAAWCARKAAVIFLAAAVLLCICACQTKSSAEAATENAEISGENIDAQNTGGDAANAQSTDTNAKGTDANAQGAETNTQSTDTSTQGADAKGTGTQIETRDSYIESGQIIPLSKTGKNVVVIVLDRAICAYVPYIFDELPQLEDSYDGFYYCPNTVSYAQHTNMAAPALYGGYEYTPTQINHRQTETLKDKHNEALKVLPVLFSQNGYTVTVCDPPYANYSEIPDVSIYEGYENINAFNMIAYEEGYSGDYATSEYPRLFKNSFSALKSIENRTVISESGNTFAMIQNDATHWPTLLKRPEYEPGSPEETKVELPMDYSVNGEKMAMDDEWQVSHYQVNAACIKAIGQWLDYLKEQGVYDNTRIIITSDHGFSLYQFEKLWMSGGRDVEFMNPLLLIKDFNSHGEPVRVDDFMTNADIPTIATTGGTIENPRNPFTNRAITCWGKVNENPVVTTSDNFYIEKNNGNVFDTSDGNWWSVHDSIFEEKNWTQVN